MAHSTQARRLAAATLALASLAMALASSPHRWMSAGQACPAATRWSLSSQTWSAPLGGSSPTALAILWAVWALPSSNALARSRYLEERTSQARANPCSSPPRSDVNLGTGLRFCSLSGSPRPLYGPRSAPGMPALSRSQSSALRVHASQACWAAPSLARARGQSGPVSPSAASPTGIDLGFLRTGTGEFNPSS